MRLKTAVAGAAILALAVGLAGCGGDKAEGNDAKAKDTSSEAAAPAPGDEGAAGFEEFDVGDPQEKAPLNIAAVYFQPVDMEPVNMGLAASESSFHLEADITAAKNDLGYGVGDFVPGLTVDYSITGEDGKVASEGTFMPMNASDGPHYGANIKLDNAGTYKVKFSIKSPEETGNLLHIDKSTGVEGRFWTEPIEAEWDWDYVPREW
jgi:uncharacterized protein involved in high-affinity Fe2+ transport